MSALKRVVIALMIKDAPRALQKPLTDNFDDQASVSDNIAALITKIKRPKVSSDTGKVSNLISEPKIELINPKRSATHR